MSQLDLLQGQRGPRDLTRGHTPNSSMDTNMQVRAHAHAHTHMCAHTHTHTHTHSEKDTERHRERENETLVSLSSRILVCASVISRTFSILPEIPGRGRENQVIWEP